MDTHTPCACNLTNTLPVHKNMRRQFIVCVGPIMLNFFGNHISDNTFWFDESNSEEFEIEDSFLLTNPIHGPRVHALVRVKIS